jgi:type IV pilus secretin PilQ/predicted competence protein
MTRKEGYLAALLALTLIVGPAEGQIKSSSAKLNDVTVDTDADATTVHVKTSSPTPYRSEFIDAPPRVVIDLQDTTYAWRPATPPPTTDPVKVIRGSQYRAGVARLVIELTRKVEYSIETEPSGLRVVMRGSNDRQAATSAAGRKPDREQVGAAGSGAPIMVPASQPEPARPEPPRKEAAGAGLFQIAQAQPTAPAPPPPPDSRRLISLDFKEADVVNLLRILATESGKNIVVGDDVKGKMSITLRNVPWEVALDTILEARGLTKVERDNLIRIVTNEQIAREREAKARAEEARLKAEVEVRQKVAEAILREQEAAVRKAAAEAAMQEAEARGPLREETIRLSYADPEEVAKTLQGILGIPPQGLAVAPPPIPGPPPIAEPPFSALYGTAPPPRPQPIVPPNIEVLSKGLTIQAHKPTNSLFVRLYATDLERIKKLIRESFDIPLPQVKIEARLESLDRFALENLGVNWGGAYSWSSGSTQIVGQGLTTAIPAAAGGTALSRTGIPFVGNIVGNPNLTLTELLPIAAATGLPTGASLVNLPVSTLPATGGISNTPTGGISFGIVGTKFNINLALQALAEQQKTRTIARPEVVTVENAKALIQLGREIPYATVSSAGTQIQFRDAVLQLQVTPVVIREGAVTRIKMNVLVENNEQGADTAAGPTIVKRRAETQVLVKEGEHLVIGGVGNSTESKSIRKVPLFGDIPVLGWLFKQRGDRESSSELVVFITPSVLASVPGTPPR